MAEQRIKLSSLVKRVEVVAATHVDRADEYLRHRHVSVGPRHHLLSPLGIPAHVDLCKCDSLPRQQLFCGSAIWAIPCRVNFDPVHVSAGYMGLRLGVTTRANTSTSTDAAPPRNRARAQASRVAPEVNTSSTSSSLRPATSGLRSGGTRNAPCTFRARPDLSKPTCCGVAFTRLRAPCATVRLLAFPITSASSADWLKRRHHWRRQCSGTGTSASASASNIRPAFAIQRPIIGARSSRSPYFKAWTSARAMS